VRKGFLVLIALGLAVTACQDKNGDRTLKIKDANLAPNVIYGSDDRKDLYQVVDDMHLALADSTVALIFRKDMMDKGDGTYKLYGKNYGSYYGLCSDQPFYEQKSAANCSGSLVGKDLILTAGHCVTSLDQCHSYRFVFGFAVAQYGHDHGVVKSSDVYACKAIVGREYAGHGSDWALIQLDREVEGHKPLPIRRSGSISTSQKLVVIGHPSGLPTKVADNAWVRDNSPASYFVTNLDTYGGNSGSAVFNADTGEIEGILVRGETDYKYDSARQCTVSFTCTDTGCRGEDVTRVSEALHLIPELDDVVVDDDEVFLAEPDLEIPDNDELGIFSTITVDSQAAGRAVAIDVEISHSWRGDLIVSVVAADGTEILLHQRKGTYHDHIVGSYGLDLIAEDDLSVLSNIDTVGDWILKVSDHAMYDVGVLKSWAIRFID
jgi:V8-like Glu-specific endopeptidase